jgi:hypothetical protein
MLIYTIIYFSKRFLTLHKVNNVDIFGKSPIKKNTKIDLAFFNFFPEL